MIELNNDQLKPKTLSFLKPLSEFGLDYNLTAFKRHNELVREWFAIHATRIRHYLAEQGIATQDDTIQLTGSRRFDVAYPESDIDFAVVCEDKAVYDAVKRFHLCCLAEQGKTQKPLDIIIATGLPLMVITQFKVELADGTVKDYQLEFTYRKPAVHQFIQSKASEYFAGLSQEAIQFYVFNMRNLYLRLTDDSNPQLKEIMNNLKAPLQVLKPIPQVATIPSTLFNSRVNNSKQPEHTLNIIEQPRP